MYDDIDPETLLEYFEIIHRRFFVAVKDTNRDLPLRYAYNRAFAGEELDLWTFISYGLAGELSSSFIDRYQDYLDWQILSRYHIFTPEQYHKHIDKVNPTFQTLTIAFWNSPEMAGVRNMWDSPAAKDLRHKDPDIQKRQEHMDKQFTLKLFYNDLEKEASSLASSPNEPVHTSRVLQDIAECWGLERVTEMLNPIPQPPKVKKRREKKRKKKRRRGKR